MALINALGDAFAGMASGMGQAIDAEERERASQSLINRAPPEAPQESKAPPAPFTPQASGGLEADVVGRAHAVYQGLVDRGMDPATAVGFAANAVHESAANPATGAGDMGASHGLMQWRAERHAGFTGKYGDSTDLNDHLDYIMHELNGPEAEAWRAIRAAANDPAAKAAAVSRYYERPKDTVPEIQRRSATAQRLAAQFMRDTNLIASIQ